MEKGGVDFKDHIFIKNISLNDNQGTVTCRFSKEIEKDLDIQFHLFRDLCLAWVIA